jgi:branched-chain amino acid transport system ATP-binding protein
MTRDVLLALEGVGASYGSAQVLHDIGLNVGPGERVSVIGANGAGKTTLLRAICGMCRTTGRILLDGVDVTRVGPQGMARAGVAHVPQGRGTFADLTVEENLRLGGYLRRHSDVHADLQYWYDIFPRLGERRDQAAGTLSGGEQQMLAVARGLISRPRLLLLDEPSLGLAPIIVDRLFEQLEQLATDFDIAMLLVEQNTVAALRFTQRAYLLQTGAVIEEGASDQLLSDDSVRRAYLGD